MKIKHFAGYGSVTATKINKQDNGETTILNILVTGEHEQGLIPAYIIPGGIDRTSDYAIKKWLLNRFDKRAKDNPHFKFNVIAQYIDIAGSAAQYTFGYNNDGSPIW